MALVYPKVKKKNMSKRQLCHQCQRAKAACFCHTITAISNQLPLVILQHPSEVKHAKGTAKIVELSLNRCRILVGENFDNDPLFNELFTSNQKLLLLYPSDKAMSPTQFSAQVAAATDTTLGDYRVIVIDGSWKKAYKIFCLNPRLATIPAIGIDANFESNYRIRKSSRQDSLSTLEACHALLTQVEGKHFDGLLRSFEYMVDFQLKSMPIDVQSRYDKLL